MVQVFPEERLTLPHFFSKITKLYPEKVALKIKRESWIEFTYQETQILILKLAKFLIQQGAQKSECICLISENSPEWVIIYFGIVSIGSICVPLDPQLTEEEIKNLIRDCQAKIIFCSYKIFKEKIQSINREFSLRVVILDAEEKDYFSFQEISKLSLEGFSLPEVSPEDVAGLLYTSGTTGKPKGVMLTHRNLCANFLSIKKLNLADSKDIFLCILPLYHSYSFMVNVIVPLFLGAEVVFCQSLKSEEFSQMIAEAKITILAGVPQLFLLLHKAIFERLKNLPSFVRVLFLPLIKVKLKKKFPYLRLLVSGGAHLEPKVCYDLNKLGLKLIEGYGLTETSPVVTLNPPQRIKPGSVGIPLPDVSLRILNPDSKGVGEVLIKGPNVMKGYFKQPDLTCQVIKDNWFYSGDLGYLDREGYLYLVGRKKEVIVLSSGKNIYPEEVETHYLKTPYIKEICILHKQEKIFGYPRDILFGVIVPNLEYFKEKRELNIRQRIRWELDNLSKDLASYQHVMGFVLTKESLPRTPLGKIKRYLVQEKYLKKTTSLETEKIAFSKDELEILNKDIAKTIINFLHRELKRPINLDSHLEIDLGIDSLSRVELGLGLERLLKLKIPESLLYEVSTVKDIILKLEELALKPKMITEDKGKSWQEILKEPPSQEIIRKIKLEFSLYDKLVTFFLKNIFLFIFRLFWFLRTEATTQLPKKGAYLICPNHASFLDGLFIFLSLPFRISLNTYFLGYQKIFESKWLRGINKFCRLISIDLDTNLTLGMRTVAYVLANNKVVCIFPEGTRSIDQEVKEFKKGIGILVKELNVPVVPVYISGSYQSWPRTKIFPRFYPVKVIFGKTIHPQNLPIDYEEIARRIRQEVLKLIPKGGY